MFRNKKYLLLTFFITFLVPKLLKSAQTKTETASQSPTTITEKIAFSLKPAELIYKEFISLSVNHPNLEISSWKTNIEAVNQYIPKLGTNKAVFTKNFTIEAVIQKKKDKKIKNATLHLTYQSSLQGTEELLIPLKFENNKQATEETTQIPASLCTPPAAQQSVELPKTLSPTSWSTYIENLIRSTDLLIIRILLIALLGLLMSFTPCIYPMIPITIGIMQGQENKSVLNSFLHAFSYSIGIATTFAALGLLAALSGTIFGMLLTNPFVVLLIVCMLVYLAFSMFGFYDIRIPSFLQEKSRARKTSFLSSFIFGAVSGTVASPCLSPGLALVLCIVASLGNPFLGFLLLFSFGIGLSIPLLLIGTFSSSLNLLPRAGFWMVEIKKIFGFLLLGMSFYYLKNIISHNTLLWSLALFCAASGIYYLFNVGDHDTKAMKWIKVLIGIAFLTGSMHLFFQAYETLQEPEAHVDTFWTTDYNQALELAKTEKKLLFIDFWAPSCSICTAIDKTLLKDSEVRTALSRFVPAKIELIMTDPIIMLLKKEFNIIGLPTFILFNPKTNNVVKRWGGELYGVNKKAFIDELNSLR